jgi:hypothetical protein
VGVVVVEIEPFDTLLLLVFQSIISPELEKLNKSEVGSRKSEPKAGVYLRLETETIHIISFRVNSFRVNLDLHDERHTSNSLL